MENAGSSIRLYYVYRKLIACPSDFSLQLTHHQCQRQITFSLLIYFIDHRVKQLERIPNDFVLQNVVYAGYNQSVHSSAEKHVNSMKNGPKKAPVSGLALLRPVKKDRSSQLQQQTAAVVSHRLMEFGCSADADKFGTFFQSVGQDVFVFVRPLSSWVNCNRHVGYNVRVQMLISADGLHSLEGTSRKITFHLSIMIIELKVSIVLQHDLRASCILAVWSQMDLLDSRDSKHRSQRP